MMKLMNFVVTLMILFYANAAWSCKQHSQCDENHKCGSKHHKCKRLTCSDHISGKKTPECDKHSKCEKSKCVPKTCEDANGPKCPSDKSSCVKGVCKPSCLGGNSSPCANGFICTNPITSAVCAAGQPCLNSYCEAPNCSNGGALCADNEACEKGKCQVIRCHGSGHNKCHAGRKCVKRKGHHSTCYLKTCADAGGPICPSDKSSCVNGACVIACVGTGSKPCDAGFACVSGKTNGICLLNQPCLNSYCQLLNCANGGKSCADNERCNNGKCEIYKCKDNKCSSDRKCVSGECYLKTCADAGGPICKGADVCRFDVSAKIGKCVANTTKTCADPNGVRCADNQKCKISPDLSGICVFKTCAESGGPTCVGTKVCRIDATTKEGACIDGLVKTCADGGGTVCPSNQKCQTNADLSGACVSK